MCSLVYLRDDDNMITLNNLQKAIIRTLQEKKECSRKELSSLLSVTPAAITLATASLLEKGLISKLYEVNRDCVGRKEVMLAVKPDSFFSIGIDIHDDGFSLIRINGMFEIVQELEMLSKDELLNAFKEMDFSNSIGVSICLKSFYRIDHVSKDIKELISFIKGLTTNVTITNNIAALAYAYKMSNPQDANFALIKYGPGLGSAFFIDNRLLQNQSSPTYEVGKMLLDYSGLTLEEQIGYNKIASSKREAVSIIKNDTLLQNRIFKTIGLAIYNVNTLLQLDKVLVSGDIFKDDLIFTSLLKQIPMSEEEKKKITRMDNYAELSKIKSALTAQYLFFSSDNKE